MSKPTGGPGRQDGRSGRWAIFVTVFTFAVTIGLGLLSNSLFRIIPIAGALALQLALVSLGVLCDLIGIAVATADLPPFVSMAAKKVRGADRGIWLIQHAERVTNLFNDVLGDIFGVLSGATGATIAAMLVIGYKDLPSGELAAGIVMTSLVAALLVGGKAAGKAFAMRNSREIVLGMGRIMSLFSTTQRKAGRKRQGNA